ncbi:MAG: hypothetical protein KF802_03475 [Bdellovibrionaceae bacterium]|nr:hypothetical protein [Pseudobdellovibrionaceae bacterium]MBX3033318.1 hypothetical protein [Pseudobdellovibrionaceae bacterium]
MKSLLPALFPALLFLAEGASAQTVVVRRVKGKQAVVHITEGQLKDGATYRLSAPGAESETIPAAEGPGSAGAEDSSRHRSLGLSFTLSSLKVSTDFGDSSSNTLSLSGRYGWNFGQSELGPTLVLGTTDRGTGAATTFGFGGFFDWNFGLNKPGVTRLYGVGFEAAFLNTSGPAGAGSNNLSLFPSVFVKWFPLGNSCALRADLGYSHQDDNTGGRKSKTQGFLAQGGLAVYY